MVSTAGSSNTMPEVSRHLYGDAPLQPFADQVVRPSQFVPPTIPIQPVDSGGSSASNLLLQTPTRTGIDEHDPWTRKNVLTLDGGGIRGYSTLLILRALMNQIAILEQMEDCTPSSVSPLGVRLRRTRAQSTVQPVPSRLNTLMRNQSPVEPEYGPSRASSHFLPSHYFDYIAGTSTGGLIAIMLGRLGMSVDECLESYENLADRVFSHSRYFHIRQPPFIPRAKYDHRPLEEVIRAVVKDHEPGQGNSTFPQPNPDMCRTIVLAWQKSTLRGTRVPYLFRTYRHPRIGDLLERNPDHIDNYPIWQVGRATAAAPTYFKAMKIKEDDDQFEFIDGGFGANNPSEEVYRSVKQMSNNNRTAVRIMVSIGTGKNNEIVKPGRSYQKYLSYLNAAVKWTSDSERIHGTVYGMTQGNADYFRLNVEEGIGKMKLDTWKGKHGRKTLQQLVDATEAYLSTEPAKELLRDSARRLVETRRARAYHADADLHDRWERFCHGVEYACGHSDCTAERHAKRRALRRHLENEHHMHNESEIERLLEEGKRFLLYE